MRKALLSSNFECSKSATQLCRRSSIVEDETGIADRARRMASRLTGTRVRSVADGVMRRREDGRADTHLILLEIASAEEGRVRGVP